MTKRDISCIAKLLVIHTEIQTNKRGETLFLLSIELWGWVRIFRRMRRALRMILWLCTRMCHSLHATTRYYSSICWCYRQSQPLCAFDETRRDTNPAHFSPVLWHGDNKEGWKRHCVEWKDVYSATSTAADKVTVCVQILPLMENSAGHA